GVIGPTNCATLAPALCALRAHTIWVVPMTTSHAPATIARTSIELIGQAITTMPASTLSTPAKMYQPRSGSSLWLIANTVSATPWNRNPTPIQVARTHTAAPSLKSWKAYTPNATDSAPLRNSSTRLLPGTSTVNAAMASAMPDASR